MEKRPMSYRIYKRKDGRYAGRLKLSDGTKRLVYAYSEIECAIRMERLRRSVEPQALHPAAVRCEQVCLGWLEQVRRAAKASTAGLYSYIQKRYLLPQLGSYTLAEVTEGLMEEYVRSLRTEGYAPSTIMNIVVVFRMALGYAERELNMPNPLRCFRIPRMLLHKEARRVPDEDWHRLKCLLERDRGAVAAAISLAVFLGMRIGEICALRCCDLDFQVKVLFVRGTVHRVQTLNKRTKTELMLSPPKTKKSCRVIPLPNVLLEKLPECCRGRRYEDFLFGIEKDMPLDPRTMQYRFKRYLKFHNITYVNFHQLRHKFAGSCVEHNFDLKSLSEILGHSNVNITLNYYVHPTMEFKRRQLNMMSESE